MKQEYNSFFDKVTSTRNDRQLLDGALREVEKRMRVKKSAKKALFVPIAAALSFVIGTVGVGAAFGYEHLTNIFGRNQSLASEIQTNVFEDSDGHVKVTIEQLLSDGRHVHAAVHYEALDEVGCEWLSEDESFGITKDDINGINHALKIESFADNGMTYNRSTGSTEIKDQRTENERYFYSVAEFCQDIWDKDTINAVFTYPTSTGIRTADINVTGTMEISRYKVTGDGVSSKYMTPAYLDISPLSYALYADVADGVFMEELRPGGGYRRWCTISFEEYSAEVIDKELFLIFTDGNRLLLPSYGSGLCIWKTGGTFDGSKYWDWYSHDYSITLDFDKLVGLEIDGVYYDLIAE